MKGIDSRSIRGVVLLWLVVIVAGILAAQNGTTPPPNSVPVPSLTADQIIKNVEARNRERAAALHQFRGTRIYRMQYRGFPSNRDAEMQVSVSYHAPDAKQFQIVSQSGSKFVIEHVFKKLLSGEQEAASEENRRRTAINSENYNFTLADREDPTEKRYVLNAIPKSDNKFLYRGKIWVDATDFAIVKIQAEPAKNPSFWIKKTNIDHTYSKVGNFWLPAKNRSESYIRLGGIAVLTIDYSDYAFDDPAPH